MPAFEAAHPDYDVVYTAVGSGAALELGRRGDADVLITHDPTGERRFMDAGHGVDRRRFMHNYFLIVGPPTDPAGIRGSHDVADALRTIAARRAPFISRGDDSGTHRKEVQLWREAGITPRAGDDWYIVAGLGMGEALMLASERAAYTLSDRGTYFHLRAASAAEGAGAGRLDLVVAVDAAPPLLNAYSVIVPTRSAQPAGARLFANWLTSPEAQALIGGYGADRFGEPLFVPDVVPPDTLPEADAA